jgi:hypothetical protein
LFALAVLFVCSVAHADLYRWVDPETGSVKLSSAPPPWYERGGGPQVEVIPYAGPGAKPAAGSAGLSQARWRELLLAVSLQPTREGLQALATLGTELDRVDPAGAAQRKSELTGLVARLQQQR